MIYYIVPSQEILDKPMVHKIIFLYNYGKAREDWGCTGHPINIVVNDQEYIQLYNVEFTINIYRADYL